MSTDISPENETFLQEAIARGRFANRKEALDEAVQLLREELETLAAIEEGLASVARGDGIPLAEAAAKLRKKHDIPPDARSTTS